VAEFHPPETQNYVKIEKKIINYAPKDQNELATTDTSWSLYTNMLNSYGES